MNPSDPYHHQNPSTYLLIPTPTTSSSTHQPQPQPQPLHPDRDRFPQWTQSETKQLLAIRAELDRSFLETKRNKPLWEAMASRMRHHGFSRTPDQCKSKWKNLITRYKGSHEAMEGDRSFAYREEMERIFEERMMGKASNVKKEKGKKKKKMGFKEALEEFGKKQMEMENRWIEAADERERERRWREEEWRREMAALEEERMEVERRWREKEEERRAREEARDERRHQVIMAILEKIGEKGLGL